MSKKRENFIKMDKLEYRAVIKFLHLQRKTPQQIHEEMSAVYGSDAPSYDVVKHWRRQFKSGRISIYDEPRSGRPTTAKNEDTIGKIEKMVNDDRRICIKTIAKNLGISHGTVCDILHNQLNLCKVLEQWEKKKKKQRKSKFPVNESKWNNLCFLFFPS